MDGESKACKWNRRMRFSEHGTLQASPCDFIKCSLVRRSVGPVRGDISTCFEFKTKSRGGSTVDFWLCSCLCRDHRFQLWDHHNPHQHLYVYLQHPYCAFYGTSFFFTYSNTVFWSYIIIMQLFVFLFISFI